MSHRASWTDAVKGQRTRDFVFCSRGHLHVVKGAANSKGGRGVAVFLRWSHRTSPFQTESRPSAPDPDPVPVLVLYVEFRLFWM